MTLYQQRLQEVRKFLNNRDTVLGYRKLMDCAADTQNMDVYQSVIDITAWKECNPEDEQTLIDKSFNLVESLEQFEVPEGNTQQPIIDAKEIIKSYGRSSSTTC